MVGSRVGETLVQCGDRRKEPPTTIHHLISMARGGRLAGHHNSVVLGVSLGAKACSSKDGGTEVQRSIVGDVE